MRYACHSKATQIKAMEGFDQSAQTAGAISVSGILMILVSFPLFGPNLTFDQYRDMRSNGSAIKKSLIAFVDHPLDILSK